MFSAEAPLPACCSRARWAIPLFVLSCKSDCGADTSASTDVPPVLRSLQSDWAAAITMWEASHKSRCFMQERRSNAEREAAWHTAQEERHRTAQRAEEFQQDVDAWTSEMAAEAEREEREKRQQQQILKMKRKQQDEEQQQPHHPGRGISPPAVTKVAAAIDGLDPSIEDGDIFAPATASYRSACDSFSARSFDKALSFFTAVIDQTPAGRLSTKIVGNRAACHYQLGNYHACLQDSLRSTELDHSYIVSHARAARCYLLLLNTRHAKMLHQFLSQHVAAMAGSGFDLAAEEAAADALEMYRKSVNERRPERALRFIAEACRRVPILQFETLRVEALAQLRPEEALEDVKALLEEYPENSELLFWRGALQYKCCTDIISLGSLQQFLLKSASLGHEKAQALLQLLKRIEQHRAVAMSFMSTRRWRQAVAEFSTLLSFDLDNSRLAALFMLQKGTAQLQMGSYSDAIATSNEALSLGRGAQPLRPSLLGLRADANCALKNYTAALADAREAHRQYPSAANADRVESIERQRDQQDRAEQPQPNSNSQQQQHRFRSSSFHQQAQQQPAALYNVLGILPAANHAAVSRAYRDAALKWHPDRWAAAGAAEKSVAEEKFKAINHAYSILSDPVSRRDYDQGVV